MADILLIGKTESYISKMYPYPLYRFGISNYNGKSFLESIFKVYKTYRDIDENEKNDKINEIYNEIKNSFTINEWFKLGDLPLNLIQENFKILIHKMPVLIVENREILSLYNIDNECIEILFLLMNPDIFDKEIIPLWSNECKNDKNNIELLENKWYDVNYKLISDIIENLENKIERDNIPKMDLEKKTKVIMKLAQICQPILKIMIQKSYESFYNEKIENTNIFPFQYLYILICNYFKLNILIIDRITGKPHKFMKNIYKIYNFENEYSFTFLLYFEKLDHYESLGKKDSYDDNKCKIKRIFKKEDPYVIAYLNYLEN